MPVFNSNLPLDSWAESDGEYALDSARFITVRAADGGFDVYRIVTEKEINKSVAR